MIETLKTEVERTKEKKSLQANVEETQKIAQPRLDLVLFIN